MTSSLTLNSEEITCQPVLSANSSVDAPDVHSESVPVVTQPVTHSGRPDQGSEFLSADSTCVSRLHEVAPAL